MNITTKLISFVLALLLTFILTAFVIWNVAIAKQYQTSKKLYPSKVELEETEMFAEDIIYAIKRNQFDKYNVIIIDSAGNPVELSDDLNEIALKRLLGTGKYKVTKTGGP